LPGKRGGATTRLMGSKSIRQAISGVLNLWCHQHTKSEYRTREPCPPNLGTQFSNSVLDLINAVLDLLMPFFFNNMTRARTKSMFYSIKPGGSGDVRTKSVFYVIKRRTLSTVGCPYSLLYRCRPMIQAEDRRFSPLICCGCLRYRHAGRSARVIA
jgi:hypothetical protein